MQYVVGNDAQDAGAQNCDPSSLYNTTNMDRFDFQDDEYENERRLNGSGVRNKVIIAKSVRHPKLKSKPPRSNSPTAKEKIDQWNAYTDAGYAATFETGSECSSQTDRNRTGHAPRRSAHEHKRSSGSKNSTGESSSKQRSRDVSNEQSNHSTPRTAKSTSSISVKSFESADSRYQLASAAAKTRTDSMSDTGPEMSATTSIPISEIAFPSKAKGTMFAGLKRQQVDQIQTMWARSRAKDGENEPGRSILLAICDTNDDVRENIYGYSSKWTYQQASTRDIPEFVLIANRFNTTIDFVFSKIEHGEILDEYLMKLGAKHCYVAHDKGFRQHHWDVFAEHMITKTFEWCGPTLKARQQNKVMTKAWMQFTIHLSETLKRGYSKERRQLFYSTVTPSLPVVDTPTPSTATKHSPRESKNRKASSVGEKKCKEAVSAVSTAVSQSQYKAAFGQPLVEPDRSVKISPRRESKLSKASMVSKQSQTSQTMLTQDSYLLNPEDYNVHMRKTSDPNRAGVATARIAPRYERNSDSKLNMSRQDRSLHEERWGSYASQYRSRSQKALHPDNALVPAYNTLALPSTSRMMNYGGNVQTSDILMFHNAALEEALIIRGGSDHMIDRADTPPPRDPHPLPVPSLNRLTANFDKNIGFFQPIQIPRVHQRPKSAIESSTMYKNSDFLYPPVTSTTTALSTQNMLSVVIPGPGFDRVEPRTIVIETDGTPLVTRANSIPQSTPASCRINYR